ncbi:MAG TPA: hypothetical protein VH186_33615 [Chloroflexia bacterium]|nr:hypothetical protein [Chloroflexia bacterium]
MQPNETSLGQSRSTQQRHHILIIDDNSKLRNLMARHILMSCSRKQLACALFTLGERAEPRLNYYHNPLDENATSPSPTSPLDFVVYEAASPRHALIWLSHCRLKYLTIVSDVMMPVDTEIGLPGLLENLSELQLGVNLIFMSSESQSRDILQQLLNGHHAFFVLKGSDAWSHLPEALVEQAERIKYYLLPPPNYTGAALREAPPAVAAISHASPSFAAETGTRSYNAVPSRDKLRTQSVGPDYTLNPTIREVKTSSSVGALYRKKSWWERFLEFFRNK